MTTTPHFMCQACGQGYDPEDTREACKCSQAPSPDPWLICRTDEWFEDSDEYRRTKMRQYVYTHKTEKSLDSESDPT